MHPIAIIDLISLFVCLIAGVLVIRGWKKPGLAPEIPALFLLLIALMALYQLALFLEWSGLLPMVNWHFLEDIAGVFIPFTWAFAFYVIDKTAIVEELESSRTRFRNLVESTSDWIWEVDTEGRYTFASPRVERILGYTPNEMLGKTPFDLMPPHEAAGISAFFKDAVQKKAAFQHLENVNLHKDGHRVFLETSGVPIFNSKGKLTGYRGIDRDITQRKMADEMTARRQEELDTLFRASPAGIALVLDHKMVRANERFYEILGYPEQERLGMDPHMFYKERVNLKKVEEHYRKALETGFARTEAHWIHKDGTGVDVVIYIAPVVRNDADKGFVVVVQDITELKVARQQAMDEKTRAQLYLDVAGVMIVVLDPQGRIILLNKRSCEILGCTAEEAHGADWFSTYVPAPYRAITRAAFDRIVGGMEKSIEYFENPIVTADGSERLIAWHNVVLRDESGAITGVISSGEDMTAARVAERTVRESDERLRVALTAARMGTWRWNAGTKRDIFDSSLRELLGLTETDSDTEIQDFFDFAHPDDREAAKAEFDRAIREHDTYQKRFRIICPDGQVRWVLDQGMPFYDFNGQLEYVAGVVVDISELQQTLQALQKSEQRYAMAQTVANIGSWDWDIQTGHLEWSEQIEPIFGMAPGQFKGTFEAFLECVHPDDRQPIQDAVAASIEQGQEYNIEHRVVWPDGTVRWVSETGDVFRDTSGKTVHMLGIVQDITERKRAEQKLRNSEAYLSSLVRLAPIGICVMKDNVYVSVNDYFCETTGYSRDELIGEKNRDINRMLYESDAEYQTISQKIYEHIRDDGIVNVETRIRRKDGTLSYQHVSGIPLDPDDWEKGILFCGLDITERKLADQALRESEAWLQVLFDQGANPIFVAGLDGQIIQVNEQACKETGYSRKELLKMNAVDIDEELANHDQLLEFWSTLLPNQPVTFESHHRRKDGSVFPVEITTSRLETPNGAFVMGIVRNITKRKETEKALTESEQRYRNFIRMSAEGIVRIEYKEPMSIHLPVEEQIQWISKKGIIAECNDLFAWMYGYKDAGEFVGSRVFDLWKDEAVAAEVVGQLIRDGYQWANVETFEITQEGKKKYFRNNLVSIIEDDYLTGQWLTQMDVTEEVQNRQALQFTQFAVDHAGESAYWMNSDATIFYVNEAACLSLGYSREELMQMSVFDLDPDVTAQQWQEIWEYTRTHGTNRVESRHKTKDGKSFPIEINGSFLVYNDKEYSIAFVRDISERKAAEQEREVLMEQLRQRNDELQSIVFTTAHDLRSPLVNIAGFTGELAKSLRQLEELLKGLPLDKATAEQIDRLIEDDIPESLGFVRSGSQHMDMLLNGLVRLSVVGAAPIELSEVDVKEVLENIIESLQYQITEYCIDISVSPDLPNCFGDHAMLTQVFGNLIENAIKYRHPERTAVIEIGAVLLNDHVEYTVADNGIGIESPHLEKVFELFHRLNLKQEQDGQGLGLTIVRRILDRLGGSAWIESVPGLGTTVHVRLPRA